jgi:hypothetical protein
MIKASLYKNVMYQGKECKMVCFPCNKNFATHEITFESGLNKQRIPLCQSCLMELFTETRVVPLVETVEEA